MIWLVSTALAAPCDLDDLRGLWPERVVQVGAPMDCAAAQVRVGDALVELGAPQQAQQVWTHALDRHGPDPQLLSRVLRAPTGRIEAQERVADWFPEQWPRAYDDVLHLSAGRAAMDADRVSDARDHLAQVGGQHAPEALFLTGVLHARAGKLKSGVRAFRDVWATEQGTPLGDHAVLNIARIYYDIQRYDQAATYYDLLGPDSELYPQAQLELGWALFMAGELDASMGALLTAQAPWFSDAWTLREARYLEGVIRFTACHTDAADAQLSALSDDLTLDLDELKRLAELPPEQLVADTFGGADPSVRLPTSTWRGFLRHTDQRVLVDAWVQAREEPVIVPELAQARTLWLQEHAGQVLHDQLVESLDQTRTLLLYTDMAQFTAQVGDPTDVPSSIDQGLTIDFTHPPRFREEPFYGEYWIDDLGDYSVWLEGCR